MDITYPDLPITERRAELLETIRDHQVVVVAGETGSGKSTQLPKFCLELGRGTDAWIGHTQPRRLAARSIAERVAEELGESVGDTVGYTVRFSDHVGPATRVKAMTDGILLAEVQRDRLLRRYDTIIIDEAHERSLNIDFLLGYLHQLLPKRSDLKVIITSATIDTERFSDHFGGAPIVEVSGRTYPVDQRYQPLGEQEQRHGIAESVVDLQREGPGDILVFCSGEREIREAAEAIGAKNLPDTEVLPLYARLTSAEQHRVFEPHAKRRVVIATNVAETSLTVPGVRYVIDPGTARISRFSNRTKVQRLPIEPVSQASANQRAGRCGRVGPGICVRLYDEEDFEARPEFTEPEIQRTNLASVLLQMASLGLGRPEEFPFVDPPDSRAIRDGRMLLDELGAVDPDHVGTKRWLTPVGRQLARLPVDPRYGRMVLAAAEHGCLREVMIITAGLSVQDIRERPSENAAKAAELHQRFDDPHSDFISLLRLWDHLRDRRKELSSSKFRKECKSEFLHHNRSREWQDIERQLRRVAKDLRLEPSDNPAKPDQIHRALLTGLLGQVGMRDGQRQEYRGARDARFAIARGSALHKATPSWVMAGELVETNRLWARRVARIKPEWVESAGTHLVKRSYGDPWWEIPSGQAMVHERVTLYGLPVVGQRRVPLGKVDPDQAREWFLHHALVEGEWNGTHRFQAHNAEILDEVRAISARLRDRMLSVDPEVLFDFFDERVDLDVTSEATFNRWWKRTRAEQPTLLDLRVEQLVETGDDGLDADAFPEAWMADGIELRLDYEFDPDSPTDGVIVDVPVRDVGRLAASDFEWNVPGLRAEVVTELIRALPKQRRKPFVPVPDTVERILPSLDVRQGLVPAVADALHAISGMRIPETDFDPGTLPERLRPTYRVFDENGDVVTTGRDLVAVQGQVAGLVASDLTQSRHPLEHPGATSWEFGDLPAVVDTMAGGGSVEVFPTLVDHGDSVGVELVTDPDLQREGYWAGTRRLLRLQLPGQAKRFRRFLTNEVGLALVGGPYENAAALYEDCLWAAIDDGILDAGGAPTTAAGFGALLDLARESVPARLDDIATAAGELLVETAQLRRRLDHIAADQLRSVRLDMSAHLDRLVYSGMIQGVGLERLTDVVRYVRGIAARLDRVADRVPADRQSMVACRTLEAEVHEALAHRPMTADAEALLWMLEEFRVSTFAQHLGTRGTVSAKRIRRALADLEAGRST